MQSPSPQSSRGGSARCTFTCRCRCTCTCPNLAGSFIVHAACVQIRPVSDCPSRHDRSPSQPPSFPGPSFPSGSATAKTPATFGNFPIPGMTVKATMLMMTAVTTTTRKMQHPPPILTSPETTPTTARCVASGEVVQVPILCPPPPPQQPLRRRPPLLLQETLPIVPANGVGARAPPTRRATATASALRLRVACQCRWHLRQCPQAAPRSPAPRRLWLQATLSTLQQPQRHPAPAPAPAPAPERQAQPASHLDRHPRPRCSRLRPTFRAPRGTRCCSPCLASGRSLSSHPPSLRT